MSLCAVRSCVLQCNHTPLSASPVLPALVQHPWCLRSFPHLPVVRPLVFAQHREQVILEVGRHAKVLRQLRRPLAELLVEQVQRLQGGARGKEAEWL